MDSSSKNGLVNLHARISRMGKPMEPRVTVIIPTYKRAPFLRYALEGLKKQTYRNFETIIVMKPGGDETEKIVKKYQKDLTIRLVSQSEEFVSKAYNLGLEKAKGEYIAFMDDDSVPLPDWLKQYVRAYDEHSDVGGISGAAIDAKIDEDGRLAKVNEIPKSGKRKKNHSLQSLSFCRPISGMSTYLIFIGRDGLIHNRMMSKQNSKKPVLSLLLMGANMSVRKKAIEGLKIDEELILGFSYEQLLSYQIWRRGYRLLHDSHIRVLHIVHDESLGRFFRTPARAAHRDAEYVLSFFLLRKSESEISWVLYFFELFSLIIGRTLSATKYGCIISASRIYGILYGFVIGCAASISKIFGGSFSIKNALSKFVSV